MAPPHYSIKPDKLTIEKMTQEIKEMTEYARDKITQARIIAHERVNKNRITKIGPQATLFASRTGPGAR